MKIKIVSNGLPQGTTVTNAETGEVIENMKFLSWSMEAGDIAMVTARFFLTDVELEGELNEKPDKATRSKPQ